MSGSRVLIVAAEASSALYAKRLLEKWQEEGRGVEAFGIGSSDMEELGFQRIGKSEELAVMGFQEVISHWSLIRETFHKIISETKKRKPDFVLLLDYPGFNLRLAKKLKPLGFPIIYYISPQVWAWKQGRVKEMKKTLDKMLVLFPFEKPFYDSHGIDCEFVGHPLLEELSDDLFDDVKIQDIRQRYGLKPNKKIIGLMPGSRNSELKYHLDLQLQVAHKLYKEDPERQFVLMVAPSFTKEEIQEQLPDVDLPLTLIKEDPFLMIRLADVLLTASGTATLMVGLMERPMVIMYRMNPFTAFLAKAFVKHTKYFGMINLILDDEVVPERFQEQANLQELASQVRRFLVDKDYYKTTVEKLKEAKPRLGDLGATSRVNEALKKFWKNNS